MTAPLSKLEEVHTAQRPLGAIWPALDQRQLLRALFAPQELALEAYLAWRIRHPTLDLDVGSLRLLPLLGKRLEELGFRDSLCPLLMGARKYHWLRSRSGLESAFYALSALEHEGVRCIPLKGLAMLPLYADAGLRPMYDTDVLVAPEQVELAIELLTDLGFHSRPRLGRAAFRAQWFGSWHSWEFVRKDTAIDLHWRTLLQDVSETGDAQLRVRATPQTVLGRVFSIPDATDLLLNTLLHAGRWTPTAIVTWVPDAMILIRSCVIDWNRLVEDAQKRRLSTTALDALTYLVRDLAAPVPEFVIERLVTQDPVELGCHFSFAAPPQARTRWSFFCRQVSYWRQLGAGPLPEFAQSILTSNAEDPPDAANQSITNDVTNALELRNTSDATNSLELRDASDATNSLELRNATHELERRLQAMTCRSVSREMIPSYSLGQVVYFGADAEATDYCVSGWKMGADGSTATQGACSRLILPITESYGDLVLVAKVMHFGRVPARLELLANDIRVATQSFWRHRAEPVPLRAKIPHRVARLGGALMLEFRTDGPDTAYVTFHSLVVTSQ